MNNNENGVPVKVQLTSGHMRYGMLLDEPGQMRRKLESGWRFISNSNFAMYLNTRSQELIEVLLDSNVVCLDVDLK